MLEQWNNQKPLRSHGHSAHGHEEHVDDWHHHDNVEGEPQEEHTGHVQGTLAHAPASKHQCQQFTFRQRLGAHRDKSLAWALVLGKCRQDDGHRLNRTDEV